MIDATCLVSVQAYARLECETEEETSVMLRETLESMTGKLANRFADELEALGWKVSIQPEYITFRMV